MNGSSRTEPKEQSEPRHGLPKSAVSVLRAVIRAVRPHGHGFDQEIEEQVLEEALRFVPYLPRLMRLGFPFGLYLLEFGTPIFARRWRRFSHMERDEAARTFDKWLKAGGLATTLALGLRTIVFLIFYQNPEVLRRLEVDWQGRANELTARRARILSEGFSEGEGGREELPVAPPEHRIEYPNVRVGSEATRDESFSADAVVVGTGAGGSVAALKLREAGLDVLMLEEGGLHRTDTFITDPATMIRRLYRDAGTSVIFGSPPIIFAEGRCVGGSTVINGGMTWRTPERVLEHWERDRGLEGMGPKGMEPYFEEAERILHPETNADETIGLHGRTFARGAEKLGWPLTTNLRNMHRCVGLNNCALGCPTGAKQSMLVTAIPEALRSGASLVTNARVDRVITKSGRAIGVRGRFVDSLGRAGRRFEAKAPLVVLAAGARHTPGILLRSGIRGKRVGRGLQVHPNAKAIGVFNERLDPWKGAHQTHQLQAFLDEGILVAYAALPPGLFAMAIPGIAEEHAKRMALYNYSISSACLIEDTGEGRVRLGPDRQPWMSFKHSKQDIERIHRGVALAARVLFAAGAREVLLPFADLLSIESEKEIERIERRKRRINNVELITVHIMGSCRMSRDETSGGSDESGLVHGVAGLAVADASALPGSVAVNPQESIVAVALRNAERWAQPARRR